MKRLIYAGLALLLAVLPARAATDAQPGEVNSPAVTAPFGDTLKALVATNKADKKAEQLAGWRKLVAEQRKSWASAASAGPSYWDSARDGYRNRAHWDAEEAFPKIKALLLERAKYGFEQEELLRIWTGNAACKQIPTQDGCTVRNSWMPSLPKDVVAGADLNQYIMDFAVWLNARFEDEIVGYSFNNTRGEHKLVATWKTTPRPKEPGAP